LTTKANEVVETEATDLVDESGEDTEREMEEAIEDDDEEGNGRNVVSGADQRREQHRMRRRSENVTMDLFPTVFVAQISIHLLDVFLLGVTRVVFTQRPHENHRNEADEKDDHHERVEDGEPMNAMLEKVGIQVFVETIVKDDG